MFNVITALLKLVIKTNKKKNSITQTEKFFIVYFRVHNIQTRNFLVFIYDNQNKTNRDGWFSQFFFLFYFFIGMRNELKWMCICCVLLLKVYHINFFFFPFFFYVSFLNTVTELIWTELCVTGVKLDSVFPSMASLQYIFFCSIRGWIVLLAVARSGSGCCCHR